MNRGDVPLLYGSEMDAITGAIGYDCNIEERIKELEQAAEIISSRNNDHAFIAEISSKPKILITGCPTTNKKVFDLIEECGAVIVAMENCGGLKTANLMVREDIEPVTALAGRYLSIPCPCMTPNFSRLSLIEQLIDEYKADGVIELTWQGCHTYNIEAFMVKEHVAGVCGKRYLQIETDYGKNDTSQIKTRVEAFLELI
jgi:benzoyl-CoA reductase/2-hydroxyglutaryl-CoA dehydratase subunit BcrC/BadD/HgdB